VSKEFSIPCIEIAMAIKSTNALIFFKVRYKLTLTQTFLYVSAVSCHLQGEYNTNPFIGP